MISAGIKEIKNNLSRLLVHVKNGEEVLITDRGNPVARIVQENPGNLSIHKVLGTLAQKGVIVLPSRSISKSNISPVETNGKLVSEMVIEDRR
jgi:prevent-host-death family protein